MSRYLKNQSGETIVEVIVSFVLLLMFTALFVVSLRYARTMSLKAETIRQTAYAQCEKLYPAGEEKPQWVNDGGTASYTLSICFTRTIHASALPVRLLCWPRAMRKRPPSLKSWN